MEEVFAQITEAIRNLQASQIAATRMIRAIISTHPDPVALRKAWQSYASPSIVEAEIRKASDPDRLAIHQALLQALKDWDGRLDRDLPKT